MSKATNSIRQVIEDLLRLVSDTEAFHQDADLKETLSQARSILLNLHKRISKPRYVLALVGLSNVGKSTLLNALLGHNLAPRRNGPCTAAPIEFSYGDTFRVTAFHRRNIQRPTWDCETSEHVHRVLGELADDSGAGASQSLNRVEVSAPIQLLADGLIIADTPGFGAAQVADAGGSHEAALKEYLEKEVSQVFWIIRALQGITTREMKFHDQWIAGICDDILVTGCEDWNEQDRVRFTRRFSDAFKNRLAPTFHFVSGLQGLKARDANDLDGLRIAGITALENRVRSAEGRLSATETALRSLAKDLRFWLDNFRDRHGRPLDTAWHPATLSWWIAQQAGSQLKSDLVDALLAPVTSHA